MQHGRLYFCAFFSSSCCTLCNQWLTYTDQFCPFVLISCVLLSLIPCPLVLFYLPSQSVQCSNTSATIIVVLLLLSPNHFNQCSSCLLTSPNTFPSTLNFHFFLWLSSTLVEEKPLCFTPVLYYFSSSSSLFQKVISKVTGRIPFILSHNIWSWCNLKVHSTQN